MKPMHVTLWHDTNVCHGMDCTDACHTIWHGTSGGFRGARGAVAPHLPSQEMQKDGCVVIKTY